MSMGFYFMQAGCCVTYFLYLIKILMKKNCEGISLKSVAFQIIAVVLNLLDVLLRHEHGVKKSRKLEIIFTNLIINPQTYTMIFSVLIVGIFLFKKNIKQSYEISNDKFHFIAPTVIAAIVFITLRVFHVRIHLTIISFVFEIFAMIAQTFFTTKQSKINDLPTSIALTNLILSKFGCILVNFLFERLFLIHIAPLISGLIGCLM